MTTLARDCAAAVLDAIPGLMRVIRLHMRSHRLPGMSVPQFRVLGFLDRYGPATLSGAAEHVGPTLPSMSRMVQSLVEEKVVQRHAGLPDRRTVSLEITAKGRRILDGAHEATVKQLASQIQSLSARQVGQLKEAMDLLGLVVGDGSRSRQQHEKGRRC
jgi:MarR family transcriptional regulator for hemolysin